LTEEGKRKKEISILTIKQFNEKVREKVSEAELKVFFGVFEKIQQVIDQDQSFKTTKNKDVLVELI
jgi:archaeosine-15-forming tRNA-guanine transglycosylase